MDKLKEIMTRCKCGVHLVVNEHRNYYRTAGEELENIDCMESPPKIAPEVRAKMIETDTIIDLQFYPDTPGGFYNIYHHDIDAALDMALECLTEERI